MEPKPRTMILTAWCELFLLPSSDFSSHTLTFFCPHLLSLTFSTPKVFDLKNFVCVWGGVLPQNFK